MKFQLIFETDDPDEAIGMADILQATAFKAKTGRHWPKVKVKEANPLPPRWTITNPIYGAEMEGFVKDKVRVSLGIDTVCAWIKACITVEQVDQILAHNNSFILAVVPKAKRNRIPMWAGRKKVALEHQARLDAAGAIQPVAGQQPADAAPVTMDELNGLLRRLYESEGGPKACEEVLKEMGVVQLREIVSDNFMLAKGKLESALVANRAMEPKG